MDEKKYKANNGLSNIFWGIFIIILLVFIIDGIINSERIWTLLYIVFAVIFSISTTIKEYVITELNFLEVRFILKFFAKNKRIAIGDIIGMKKLKKNQLRIDLVRGFEILRVKESDIDALIAELKDRNPRIKMPEEE
ncbi:MAG TPA: hypothetical protein GX712_05305 [Bacteroidales bacterium]|nr:hypothetical protein [Bacteroidales bacterium]